MAVSNPQMMHCMEVWGGSQTVDTSVAMAGLDAWVYSRPFGGSAAGGDVYYVSSCATGRITRLLVADVSGHGSAVCETAASLQALMRRYVNYLDQGQFVRSMNEQFSALSKNGSFATAVVTTFFAPTRHLSVCNAGHPPPLWYRAAEKRWRFAEPVSGEPVFSGASGASGEPGQARKVADGGPEADEEAWPEGTNLPLGVLDLADYQQFDLVLEPGDVVLCYTDSLMESHGRDGQMLGPGGLLRLLRRLPPAEPEALVPALLSAVAAEAPGNLTEDDVTVLVFRPNGKAERAPLRQRCLAPARVLGGLIRSLRGGVPPWPEFSLANLGGALFNPLSRTWRGRTRRVTTPPRPRPPAGPSK